MAFTVKLADKIIYIENIHPELKDFCKDYLVGACTADFSIQLSQEDILFERQHTTEDNFSSAYLETLALLRKIADIFPNYQRFLIHGASISYNDEGFLFTAPSGTGKSTHIRLWKQYLGDDVKIVNGDKPFISMENKDEKGNLRPLIYGTPWAGKEHWQRNCSRPLKAICFIERGTTNTIRRLDPGDCITKLFTQIYLPDNATSAAHTLELVDMLVKHIPLYILTCDMSEDAVQCSFETLTGRKYPS